MPMYKVKRFKDEIYDFGVLTNATDKLNNFVEENYIMEYEVLSSETFYHDENLVTCIVIKYKEAPCNSTVIKNGRPIYVGDSEYDALKHLSTLDFLNRQESEDIMFGNVETIVENGTDIYRII